MKFPITFPPGLVSNDTTYVAEGRVYDCSGARCYDGGWQQLGGFESIVTDTLDGVCRTVLQWTDNAGNLNVALGRHNGLDVYYGGEVFDITPAAFVAGNIDGAASAGYGTSTYGTGPYGEATTDPVFPMTWSFGLYGESLIANAREQGIWQWNNNTAAIATVLTNAPAQCTFVLVTPTRQVVAFGCTPIGGGDLDPMLIRGSDIEDANDWTPTTANNAFEYALDSGSRIVCGYMIGPYQMVWTDAAFYLGTFIGAPDETWRYERQGVNCGAIGPNAVIIDGQIAKWISPDGQFWAAGIGGAPVAIPCPIQTDFAASLAIGQNDKIVGTRISRLKEVRWFYADGRDGYEISRSVALDPDGNWSKDASQPRTAYCDANPSADPIGVTYAGNLYWQERGTTADGGFLSGYLETADFIIGDGEDIMQVQGCWPDFKSQQGTINRYLLMRLYPQDATVRTKGPYAFTPEKRKKDFLATGRVARIRDEWNASPAQGRWGKSTFEIETAGQR